ncbi:hypothetical protein K501DRAFT_307084 [Backusella circina FSU 941]|nr:hypothetical protein K501DRAFT_307084 [Backusella circina FSU 941]
MQLKSPIIVVEDTINGPISTTGIHLDQFMQMTDERDFKQYGIKKTKHCRTLSTCADSIRRTSLSSISSSSSSDEDDDDDTDHIVGSTNISLSKFRQYYDSVAKQINLTPKWPNSQLNLLPPQHSTSLGPPLRRLSAPLVSSLPNYRDLNGGERRHSHSEGMRRVKIVTANNELESLPDYTCTVQKIGRASVKCEFTSPGTRPLRRQWRTIQMELSGTLLKLFEIKSNNQLGTQMYPMLIAFSPEQKFRKTLYMSHSLANASVSIATDYTKKHNVFRLVIDQGPTLLIHVQTNAEVSSWMEKITAGSNICEDLAYRRMPNFFPAMSEPYAGWNSEISRDTVDLFENYAAEDRRRRRRESEPDVLI